MSGPVIPKQDHRDLITIRHLSGELSQVSYGAYWSVHDDDWRHRYQMELVRDLHRKLNEAMARYEASLKPAAAEAMDA